MIHVMGILKFAWFWLKDAATTCLGKSAASAVPRDGSCDSVYASGNIADCTMTIMADIKCCNQGDACKTPRPSMGHPPCKLSTPYYGGLDEPGKPTMAMLIEIAKRAKAKKLAGQLNRPQVLAPFKKPTVQPLKRKAPKPSIAPSISPLLSRRMGRNILMTVQIPPRNPFPPPLAPSS
ncbi:hypothetical protein M758_6G175000 [Ceratodon purpureus]|nr:hypothetical protein M758_6G175000 [Ceratodon purpureus]